MDRLKALIESRGFELAITWLIVINAVTLGLETLPGLAARWGGLLHLIDHLLLAVFVVELLTKVAIYRLQFFRDPWRVFDFIVVGISLLPSSGPLSILRALRVLRILRLVSIIPSMRRVVGGLFRALPSMGSIFLLLLLVFYVFSVMATKLYSASFPEMFGNIAASAFTLFQVMTLEGWAGDVVRPVMERHPHAWMFFLPFILATSFTVLNLFIGIIVSAMESEHEAAMETSREEMQEDQAEILREIRELRREIADLRRHGQG
ncbi:MAG: ion transporter [Rhizobiaceae bacterium]|nr:ion transporter [Rhizobiaceae bacterium]